MENALFDLTDRVAIVTGAAQGMGRAGSMALAQAGAHLVLVDLNGDGAAATAAEIEKLGRRAVPVVCDVSEPEQLARMFERVDQEFGRLDFLANIAGEGLMSDPLDLTPDQLAQVFRNLVIGRFYACQEAARRMFASGGGSIVNQGSLASVSALGRGHVAYSMAMGAVAQMTRELSTEWAARGVRVNAILPGQVLNPGLEQRIAEDPDLKATFMRGLPAGRMGRPDDIQGLLVFLASDASSWITGALIPLDGGNLALNASGTWPGTPKTTF